MTLTLTAIADTATAAPVALKLSSNRKVSPLVKRAKNRAEPVVQNAFGLPAGPETDQPLVGDGHGSCPDATDACVDCYADAIPYPSMRQLLQHNFDALKSCHGIDEMVNLISAMLKTFEAQCEKHGTDKVFRNHWSGDFYDEDYAAAWIVVMRNNPQIQFWQYTRSFVTVPAAQLFAIADLPNCETFLSVDKHNAAAAATVLARYPTLHAAALGVTFDDASAVLRSARGPGARAPKCPENSGKLPLVVTSDRRAELTEVGTRGVGACVACGLCVFGRRDVLFSVTGR